MTEVEADGRIDTRSETDRQRDMQKDKQMLSTVSAASLLPLVIESTN